MTRRLLPTILTMTAVLVNGHAITHAATGDSVRAVTQKATKRRVTIDIKPGDEPTMMDPKSRGMLPVALLSTKDFDAAALDLASVRFGATGKEATAVRSMVEDVNRDGTSDRIFLFRMTETGIDCSHTSASLTGSTTKGEAFEGSESFKTNGCDARHETWVPVADANPADGPV